MNTKSSAILYAPTDGSTAVSGAASGVANEASGFLQDDDPTDKGSVGKAALSGAAKGAAAGVVFGPWGAVIGGAIGAGIGTFTGVKAKKEGLAANAELEKQQQMTVLAENQNASMEEYKADIDLASVALGAPTKMKSLSSVGLSYSPLKMKAKEASRAATMMKISGADTVPERSSLTYKKH